MMAAPSKVCVVTGTRAEYGLLQLVMQGIKDSQLLDLQLVVTGMHLSPEFGFTVKEIEADGFQIDRKVEMLLSSDTPVGITKSMGIGLIGFADAIADLQPDLILILGDRFEIFAAATAAMIARVPIAHLHGGEATEGSIDEPIRHSITKMSQLHFVAAEEYQRRVIQLGEQPDRVYNVGGLGVDNITNLELLNREELELALNFKLLPRNLLITFHPVTLEKNTSANQMEELLSSLGQLKEIGLIFTMPNADTEGRALAKQVKDFCYTCSNAKSFISLGQLRYLSCVKHVDGVIGNSSSGIMEAPSFKKGTINIGDRQRGRIKAESVIDCDPNRIDIDKALERLFSPGFQAKLEKIQNPYGNGGASDAIVQTLQKISFGQLLKKCFYDLIAA